jgi:hypothetical protein
MLIGHACARQLPRSGFVDAKAAHSVVSVYQFIDGLALSH